MTRLISTRTIGALLGAALLAQSAGSSASAFTLSAPSIGPSFSAGQIDKVWWRHHHYWGWHRRHCWMSPWGWRCHWW